MLEIDHQIVNFENQLGRLSITHSSLSIKGRLKVFYFIKFERISCRAEH